ncbi:MAG: hypothetical protein AAFO07_12805 [Bacteroidota bacterium]
MKRFYFLLILLLGAITIQAQSQDAFAYQAVVRNLEGEVISNATISMRFSILQASVDGQSLYTETHNVLTSRLGHVNLKIGMGSNVSGDFSSIDFSAGPYFLKVEVDDQGGDNFSELGTTQLLAVPFALVSKIAKSVDYEDVSNAPAIPEDVSDLTDSTGLLVNERFTSRYTRFTGLSYLSTDITDEWTPLAISEDSSHVFTKERDDTVIEIHLNARLSGGSFNSDDVLGVRFAITVDDQFSDFSNQASILRTNTSEFMSIMAVYDDLPAGTYKVRLVARTPNRPEGSTRVRADSGNWGGAIIVKETH